VKTEILAIHVKLVTHGKCKQ